MYIYQLIGRANTREDAREICRIFEQSLARVQEPGYAGGFCAINPEDQLTVLIQEEWGNPAGIQAWQASDAYQLLRKNLKPLMEGIWETVSYKTSG